MQQSLFKFIEEVTLGMLESFRFTFSGRLQKSFNLINGNKKEGLSDKIMNPPIILIPGFLSNDFYMRDLKNKFEAEGYSVYGISECVLGQDELKVYRYFNKGWDKKIKLAIFQKVEKVIAETGLNPVLIGWSLGGIFAREVSDEYADFIGGVITLASPISLGFSGYNSIGALYGSFNNDSKELDKVIIKINKSDKKKNTISIIANKDRVIDHKICYDEEIENYFVNSYHLSIMNSPESFKIMLDFLRRIKSIEP